MKATVIETNSDHGQAKSLIEKLIGSSDPADRAQMTAQARLIEAYEQSRWPSRPPSLPNLLIYLMDQHGLSRADLMPLLGTPCRVSEVLTGKRELSMSMVRKLRNRFQISADLLISPIRRRGIRHKATVSSKEEIGNVGFKPAGQI